MRRSELIDYLNQYLSVEQYQDYAPNGLQISGVSEIQRLVTGVSANQALIDAAIACGADALLVHHGFFWKHDNPCITGIQQRRIHALLKHGINLLAYHLPLDGHATVGNNIQLAHRLDIKVTGEMTTHFGPGVGMVGQLHTPMHGVALAEHLAVRLARPPLHIAPNDNLMTQIAWCTGAAPDLIYAAADAGVDAYITGEIAERTVAIAKELGIHFFAAGHHATERDGVRVLGEHLSQQFGLTHQFIDINNPV